MTDLTKEREAVVAILTADSLPECSFDDGKTWEIDGVGVAETFTRAANIIETLTGKATFTVDELAQEIRRVDGSNDLGAGALAEALMPFVQGERVQPAPITYEPCGGCGATSPLERCFGCFHKFETVSHA